MVDELTLQYAESLFNQRWWEIYAQEETDLEAVRKSCIHNGMVLAPQYVKEVGRYLVKRTSDLADAKRESLLTAIETARLPLDSAVLGQVTSIVIDFCNKQQHQDIKFLTNHVANQPGLNNVSNALKDAVIENIQSGISGVMKAVNEKMKAARYKTMLDARNNQAVYASALGKRWDVFISHASEDKEAFVDPLAKALEASGLTVWYDKTVFTVGDRLRQKIDEGLAQSRYGIVILSHSFFAKQWPKEELEGLFAREIAGAPGVKVILPVWHNVTKEDVIAYSPMLAGRYAANSNDGPGQVARQLRQAMGMNNS